MDHDVLPRHPYLHYKHATTEGFAIVGLLVLVVLVMVVSVLRQKCHDVKKHQRVRLVKEIWARCVCVFVHACVLPHPGVLYFKIKYV